MAPCELVTESIPWWCNSAMICIISIWIVGKCNDQTIALSEINTWSSIWASYFYDQLFFLIWCWCSKSADALFWLAGPDEIMGLRKYYYSTLKKCFSYVDTFRSSFVLRYLGIQLYMISDMLELQLKFLMNTWKWWALMPNLQFETLSHPFQAWYPWGWTILTGQ